MKFNHKHWANNAAGAFLVAVFFFVATIVINRAFPSGATGALLWLFALVGLVALGAWTWLNFQIAGKAGQDLLFAPRRAGR
jgi:hypothetical protein